MDLATCYTPWGLNLAHLSAPALADRSLHILWAWLEKGVGWGDGQSWAVTPCSVVPMLVSTGAAPATAQALLTPSCTILQPALRFPIGWAVLGTSMVQDVGWAWTEAALRSRVGHVWPYSRFLFDPLRERKRNLGPHSEKDVKQPASKHTYLEYKQCHRTQHPGCRWAPGPNEAHNTNRRG